MPSSGWTKLASLALVASGCMPLGRGDARLVEVGRRETTVALTAGLTSPKLSPGEPAPLPYPMLAAERRWGVAPGWDVAGRLWGLGVPGLGAFGLAVDGRRALRQAIPGSPWDLALGAGAGLQQWRYGGQPTHGPFAELTLRRGYRIGRGAVYAGAGIWPLAALAADIRSQAAVLVGGWLGVELPLGAQLRLRTELAARGARIGFNGARRDPEREGVGQLDLQLGVGW